MSLAVGVLLFVAGVAAGFVNTVAGAGSLLTVPALLFAGLPAGEANATNRVAVLVQSLAGGGGFARRGRLDVAMTRRVAVPVVIGGAGGAVVATVLADDVLLVVLLVVMVGVGARFVRASPAVEPVSAVRADRSGVVGWGLLAAAGFYGGLVQTGVGIVLLAVFAGVLGLDLVGSNALKMVVTGMFTVASLAVFVAAGLVEWAPGLVMAAGSAAGALLGVRVAVDQGQGLIRLVVLVMVAAVVVQQVVGLVRA